MSTMMTDAALSDRVESRPAHDFSTDTDRTSVWIQDRGECVARFGRMAWEVMTDDENRRLHRSSRVTSAQSWIEFKECVAKIHGFTVVDGLTPLRFHEALGLSFGYHPEDTIFEVPLSAIRKFADPLEFDVWGRGEISRATIRECIAQNRLAPEFKPMGIRNRAPAGWDSQRVAYLVLNRDPWPIGIEVTSPDGSWTIEDGFHRLAAAVYRRDRTIEVSLSGFVDGYGVAFPKRIAVS